jgi:hypothetical protein
MVTGGCMCGGVRYEVDPERFVSSSYCHCTRCQRRSGAAASANVRVDPGAVRIVEGEDLISAWQPEGGYAKLFCSMCGSALFTRPPDGDEPTGVRLGSFDDDPGIRPQWRQFTADAAPWEPIPDDGLPRYPQQGSRPALP